MRAAVIVAAILFGSSACGDVTSGPGVESVRVGATAEPTSPAPATAAPTTPPAASGGPSSVPKRDPVETSSTSVGVLPGVTASQVLQPFVAEVDALSSEGPAVLSRLEAAGRAGTVDEALLAETDALGARFAALVDLVPPGLHPDVQDAVDDVLFDLGDVLAPLTSAWGWEPATLAADFGEQMRLGAERLPADRARAVEAAGSFPDVMAIDPASRDAAEHAVFRLVLGRGLGHQSFLIAPEWSVRWVGGPPDDPDGCIGPLSGRGSFEGDFVPGAGGCALVLYDTRDPYSRERDLEPFLADPASTPVPDRAEIVTVRPGDDGWEVTGSVE